MRRESRRQPPTPTQEDKYLSYLRPSRLLSAAPRCRFNLKCNPPQSRRRDKLQYRQRRHRHTKSGFSMVASTRFAATTLN